MIPNHLSPAWSSLATGLGNHLWQSTLFVIAAGLLTLVLRKNHARVRYWLWLAASVKFLIPFSLLVAVGSYLPGSRGTAGTNAAFYVAVEQVSLPFSPPAMPVIPQGSASKGLIQLLPVLVLVAWLCGFLVVIFHWFFRWGRISAAIRKSVPLHEGREVQTLRQLERTGGMRKATEMLLSRTSLEPGVFGITRPVLLWPEEISKRLEDAHLEAILAHELWHVRRRDNLAAAIHMVVEAIFWFYPLVWWMGARLLEERERACDEEVLESGSDRQVYAESILKICEFCIASPLVCVSGVTGADLKKRMAYIMTKNLSRKLDFSRKLLLSAAGLLAGVVPIALGLAKPTKSRAESQSQDTLPPVPLFESASIKPNTGEPMAGFTIVGKPFKAIMWKGDRLMATNFTLHGLLRVAYALQDDQISGGPDWLNSEGFDVDVKIGKSTIDEMQKRGGVSGRTLMLQELLSDRFKLSFHHETKDLPIYALVTAANGPRVQPAKPGDTYPNGLKCLGGRPCGSRSFLEPENNKLVGQGVPLSNLVELLSEKLGGRIVLDKTGLAGDYDFTLQLAPEENEAAISKALEEQLGLKLEPQKAPTDVLVIDHAEKPAQSQAQSTRTIVPSFEAVTNKPDRTGEIARAMEFKPDRFVATNVTLHGLIAVAYAAAGSEILGGPDWVRSENYDIEAKLDTPVIDELSKLGPHQRLPEQNSILQALLADRFRLTLHREKREPPAHVLAIAKDGFKLQEARPGDAYPDGFKDPQGRPLGAGVLFQPGPWKLVGQGVRLVDLAKTLSVNYLGGQAVIDRTGLSGAYDFTLDCHTALMERGESVLTVLPEQSGLELKLLDALVIDRAEKPLQNWRLL
jgi:bla regulator protein blaR1